MSTVTPNLGLFKYNTTTDLNVAFNINTALNQNWDKIDEAISNSGGARNIGEIVASTIPLTDAGLHLLDGSLIQGDGIYSAFVTYIAGLVSTYPDLFVTESDWQQSITDYDVCGKFVYDSINNTVRLPKYSNQIITKTSAISTASTVPVIGNGTTLGLTDGTNNFSFQSISGNNSGHSMVVSGAYGTNIGSASSTGYVGANKTFGVTSDGTKSGLIADISSIKNYPLDCYYYIVIATSTKTDIQVDIDEIATDLNWKADTDLSNTSPTSAFATAMNTAGIRTVVETYVSGTSWYRVYSDGWCEQGGYNGNRSANTTSITFLKPYANSNYNVTTTPGDNAGGNSYAAMVYEVSTTGFTYYLSISLIKCWWRAEGYIS